MHRSRQLHSESSDSEDNRGLVLTFSGDVGNVSPSDFPLIVRYEDGGDDQSDVNCVSVSDA